MLCNHATLPDMNNLQREEKVWQDEISRQLRSQILSRRTKTELYKSLIIPILLYGAEHEMATSVESTLRVLESKVLRKMYGPLLIVNGEYCFRWNGELYETQVYDGIDIVQRIKRQRLRWLNHFVHMDENTLALKVFDAVAAGGSIGGGRPPLRLRDKVWPLYRRQETLKKHIDNLNLI